MSVTELNTTRINRLLRPLRVTCIQLDTYSRSGAALGPSSSGQTTYSKIHTWRPSEKGPLALILPPQASLAKTRPPWQSGGVRNAELAKKIYAVHTAFKNVLQAALGSGDVSETGGRVKSLASLCATVVGEGIQEEVDLNLQPGVETAEDEEEKAIIEEMYDYVPMTYRRFTLIAHALSMVLDLCPHDPTLLLILLRTTISYNLHHESQIILRSLLYVAIPHVSSPQEPLCHPAHVGYLSDLLSNWTAPPTSSASSAMLKDPFSIASFMEELLPVLFENASGAVWTSDAIRALAKDIRAVDAVSFMHLSECIAVAIASQLHRSDDNEGHATSLKGVRPRFTKWIKYIIQDIYSQSNPDTAILGTAIDLLSDVVDLDISSLESRNAKECSITASVLSLAVVVLAKPNLSHAQITRLSTIIGTLEPCNTSYDPFVTHLFPKKALPGPSSSLTSTNLESPNIILQALKVHARVLRAQDLRAHEASLWACALRRLELDWLTTRALRETRDGRGDAVDSLRAELVQRSENAERRKGKGKGKENVATATPARGKNEKVWDDFAGCWMTRTPARPGILGRDSVRRPVRRPRPPLSTVTPRKPFMELLVGSAITKAGINTMDDDNPIEVTDEPALDKVQHVETAFMDDEEEETWRPAKQTPHIARRFAELMGRKKKPKSPLLRRRSGPPKSPFRFTPKKRTSLPNWHPPLSPVVGLGRASPSGALSPLRDRHRRHSDIDNMNRRRSAHTPLRSSTLREDDDDARPTKRRRGAHTPKRRSLMLPPACDDDGDDDDDDDDDDEAPWPAMMPVRSLASRM